MRIALVADLHGNWPATQTVAADIARRGIGAIYCLGDLVGKGPSSHKTCDWAREHCQVIIGGNWDVGIGYQKFPRDDYYWKQLGEERLAYLRSLPLEHTLTLSGLNIRLIHGRPLMPELINPQASKEAFLPYFEKDGQTFDALGYADWHRAALRTLDVGYLFNCGSVGNAMGVPKAHYLILEGGEDMPTPLDFTFVCLPYDNKLAANQAQADKSFPFKEAYIREVLTGVYSR